MKLMITCPNCGRTHEITLTNDEWNNLNRWANRELLIQDALPDRNPYERELIRYHFSHLPMISCCKECYEETWGVEEE